MPRKKLGETLVAMGVIDQATLEQALELQKTTGRRLGQILEQMDAVLEEDIAHALAKQFGFRYAKGLSRFNFPEEVLNLCEAETALTKLIFPLKLEGKTLHLAMANPLDIDFQNDFSFKIGLNIEPCVSSPGEIKAAIKKNYLAEIKADEDERLWSILLVDDQDIVLSTAEAALKKEGYRVHKAENGAEGLKKAIQLKPHLIISDVLMPRMNGEEMFRALQANQGVADIPVIALSAKATAEEEYRLLEMGFYDFVPKPITPLRLVARVRRAMRMTHGAHNE